jgi:hypothetical protein
MPKLDFTFGLGNVPAIPASKDTDQDNKTANSPDSEEPKEDGPPAAPPAEKALYQFRATSSPKRDADGFATPEVPAHRLRRRTVMQDMLLDPLRHDVLHVRGSTSEKRRAARRRRTGTPARSDWRVDLCDGIPDDESSPVHDQLRWGKS